MEFMKDQFLTGSFPYFQPSENWFKHKSLSHFADYYDSCFLPAKPTFSLLSSQILVKPHRF